MLNFDYLDNFEKSCLVIDDELEILYLNKTAKQNFSELKLNEKINLIYSKYLIYDSKYFDCLIESYIEENKKYFVIFIGETPVKSIESKYSEKFTKEILDNKSFYFYQFDHYKDKFEYLSDSASDILNIDIDKVLKYGVKEVQSKLSSDDWDNIQKEISDFVEFGSENFKSFTREYRYISDKDNKWILDSFNLYLDHKNRLSHSTGVCVDITDYKSKIIDLENELKRTQQLIESNFSGKFSIDLINQKVLTDEKLASFLNNNTVNEFNYDAFSEYLIDFRLKDIIDPEFAYDGILRKIKILNQKKNVKHYLFKTNVIKEDELGNPTLISCILLDIDKQINSLETNESNYEALLNNLFNSFNSGVVLTAENGSIEVWNHFMERLTGLRADKVIGEKIWNVQHIFNPEINKNSSMKDQIKVELIEFLRTGNPFYIINDQTNRIYNMNNSFRIVELFRNTVKTDHGHRIIQIVNDVTSENIILDELKTDLRKYQELIEYSREVFFLQNFKQGDDYVSSFIYDLLEYTPDEFLNKSTNEVFDLIHPEDREEYKKYHYKPYIEKYQPQDKNIEYRIRNKKGIYKYVSENVKIYYDDNNYPNSVAGSIRDITDKKQIENELNDTLHKYKIIVNNQSDLVVKVDSNNKFTFVNKTYCNYFNKSEDELLGNSFMPLIHEEDRLLTAVAMEKLNVPPYTCYIEQRVKTDKGWRWLAWKDKAILDDMGNITEVIGVGRDITEKKEIEIAYKISEINFKEVFEGISKPIIVFNFASKKIIDANLLALDLFQYDKEEFISFNLDNISSGADISKNIQNLLNMGSFNKFELKGHTKNGETIKLKFDCSLIKFNGEDAVVAIIEK